MTWEPQPLPFRPRRRGPVRYHRLKGPSGGRIAAHLSLDCPTLHFTNPDSLRSEVAASTRQFALSLREESLKACLLCAAEPTLDWALSRPSAPASPITLVTAQKPAWAYTIRSRPFSPSTRPSKALGTVLKSVAARLGGLPHTDTAAGTIIWAQVDEEVAAALGNMTFTHSLPRGAAVTPQRVQTFSSLWTRAAGDDLDPADVHRVWSAVNAVV